MQNIPLPTAEFILHLTLGKNGLCWQQFGGICPLPLQVRVSSVYMVQLYRQVEGKEATENFLAVLNLTMKMEAVHSSTRKATQPTSRDRTNSST